MATLASAARAGHTAAFVVGRSSANSVGGRSSGVDTKGNPAKKAVLDGISEKHVLDKGVGRRGLLQENAVLGIRRQALRVGGIDCGSLDLRDEVLVKKDLADVGGGQIEERAVGGGRGVEVDQDVDMGGPACVVSGDEGVEEHDTIVVGLLDAAEERGVEVVGRRCRVAVATGTDTRVDARGVAVCHKSEPKEGISLLKRGRRTLKRPKRNHEGCVVLCSNGGKRTPDFSVDTHNRFAGLNVQDLEIKSKGYTGLILGDVLTDILAGDVVRALSDLRGKDTRAVAGEQLGLGGGEVVVFGGQVRDV